MIETVGLSLLGIIVWVLIGFLSGLAVYYLDQREKGISLIPILITSISGAILGGALTSYIFRGAILTLTDLIIAATGAFLFALIGRMLLIESEEQVENTSRFEYATYSTVTKLPESHLKHIEKLISDLNYPVSKADLLRMAEKNGADAQDLTLLEELEDHLYENQTAIKQQFN